MGGLGLCIPHTELGTWGGQYECQPHPPSHRARTWGGGYECQPHVPPHRARYLSTCDFVRVITGLRLGLGVLGSGWPLVSLPQSRHAPISVCEAAPIQESACSEDTGQTDLVFCRQGHGSVKGRAMVPHDKGEGARQSHELAPP